MTAPPAVSRRAATRIAPVFEMAFLLFAFLILKDWLISGVDFYPYREACIITAGIAAGACGVFGRPPSPAVWLGAMVAVAMAIPEIFGAASHAGRTECLLTAIATMLAAAGVAQGRSRLPQIICSVALIAASSALALAWIQDILHVPWTADNVIGLGLGSADGLSTSFISENVQLTPIPAGHTSMGLVAGEFGLLAVAALALACVVSAIAAAVVLAEPHFNNSLLGMERGPQWLLSAKWMVGSGLTILNALMCLACHGPAYLTLTTPYGTCALMLALGAIAAVLARATTTHAQSCRSSSPASASADVPARKHVSTHDSVLRRLALVLAAVAALAAGCSERSMYARIAALAGTGRPSGPTAARIATEYVPISGIAQVMQDSTVAMEDGHFYHHHGFDWEAIHRALRFDLRLGEVKQGGSTITQQLAKNLFLSDDRSFGRKVQEAALAWEMERTLDKKRILELYLNVVDYGMGQRGIKAAALYYFHKTPAELTMPEAAILVGIVPDPMHEQADLGRVLEGEQTALARLSCFFPNYAGRTRGAGLIPLDRLVYPYKDAWDRGATETIPATWHGISFYFFANPDTPLPIDQAAECLKTRMPEFLDEARKRYHVVGIDHLGLYNDRPTRQNEKVVSAHAFGQAIDISGFRFADGTQIKVADHNKPSVLKRLQPLEDLLKKHFDIVVDWRDDPIRHQTHFHTEVRGPRPTAPRPPSAYPPETGVGSV